MGYSTDFEGSFKLTKPLTTEQIAYLRKFSGTRRMARRADITEPRPDVERLAVGLPIGEECGYYTGSTADFGQDRNDAGIIDYNRPPSGQPGLWCQWVPSDDGSALHWNDAEKFYRYVEWANYLLDHFLSRWGIAFASSDVKYEGESRDDFGRLIIDDSGRVAQVPGKRVWGDE